MERKCKIPRKGIVFNPATGKWEVYGPELVIRDGRRVPIFTAESFHKAVTWAMEVEGWR